MSQKILEVHIGSEFDHGPEIAVVEITPALDARIRQLATAAKALGVYKITEFDGSPDFFLRDYDAEEDDGPIAFREPEDEEEGYTCRVECVTLNVTSNDYFWSGYVKHTSIRWETDSIPLETVETEPANRQRLPQSPLSVLRTIEASLVIGSMKEPEIQKVALGEVQRVLNRPTPYLGIVLQGGIIVQAIVSDQPELMADWKVMVIDYDTESTPDEELVKVPQSDGSVSKAWTYLDCVTQTAIDLKAVYEALP